MPLSDNKIVLFPQRVAKIKVPPDTVAVTQLMLFEPVFTLIFTPLQDNVGGDDLVL